MTPSRFARIGLLGLVVVVAILAFAWSRKGVPGGSADRFAAAMERELARQGVDTALRNRVGAPHEPDPADSRAADSLAAELGRKGIARLTTQQLRERMELLLHLDSTATTEQCAARLMGSLGPADMQQMISTLDDPQLQRWAQIAVAAIRGELQPRSRTPVAPTEAEVTRAFERIHRSLPAAEEQRFVSVMQSLGTATAADRCWAALTVAKTTLALPYPPQAEVLATLGKLEAGL